MNIIPLGARILVKFIKEEEKKGVLIIPNQAPPQFATIIEIGDDDGLYLEIGQKVILSRYGGHEVILNDEKFLIVELKDVIAVLEDSDLDDSDET